MNTDIPIFSSTTIAAGDSASATTEKIDLYSVAADAQLITMNMIVTTGAGVNPGVSALLTVYYAFSNTDYATPADAKTALASDYIAWRLSNAAGGPREVNSSKIPITAQYLYIWYTATTVAQPFSLVINSVGYTPITRNIAATATAYRIDAAGEALDANPNRLSLTLQNIGINPVYVNFRAENPLGAADCDLILCGDATVGDGRGGYYTLAGYTGVVHISGTDPNLSVIEI